MLNTVVSIVAKNPPSILLALGGVGVLLQISGAGILLFLGVLLQFGWMALRFGL